MSKTNKIKERWHHKAANWNRQNIAAVLFRNPALASALELLGVNPQDLAIRAEERENRRRPYEERANMLAAHSTPDRRVGPAKSSQEQQNTGGVGNRKPFRLYDAPVEAPKERPLSKLRRNMLPAEGERYEWSENPPPSRLAVHRKDAGVSLEIDEPGAPIPELKAGVEGKIETRIDDLAIAVKTLGKLQLRSD